MSFLENTRKPRGLGGKVMVSAMNVGHRALSDWGLQQIALAPDAEVLDVGCGGGANIAKLLVKCPAGKVCGVDYAQVSVQKSQSVNRGAIEDGRCTIVQASVMELPFADARFDLVTAFETVYFWPDLAQSFREVHRVLQPGGTFFICNECGGENPRDEKWTEKIDGMKIYSGGQLRAALEQSGFADVQTRKRENGWLCVTARKL